MLKADKAQVAGERPLPVAALLLTLALIAPLGAPDKASAQQQTVQPAEPRPIETMRRDGDDFKIAVGDRVFFDAGSAEIGRQELALLHRQAVWLARRSETIITLEAHADDPGSGDINRSLSRQRADAVKAALIAEGIAPARIRIVAFGREKPIAMCAMADRQTGEDQVCAAQNRRVVTAVTWPPQAISRAPAGQAQDAAGDQAAARAPQRSVPR